MAVTVTVTAAWLVCEPRRSRIMAAVAKAAGGYRKPFECRQAWAPGIAPAILLQGQAFPQKMGQQ